VYSVRGQVYVALKINGQEIDFARVHYGHFVLRTHVGFFLPSLDFELQDHADALRDNPMKDGDVVEVALSEDDTDDPPFRRYRVFKARHTKILGTGTVIQALAYYDAPAYVLDKKMRAFRDRTSSSVVEEIAGECGLPVRADATADRQTWVCRNLTYAQWLKKELLVRSYGSETSAYVAGVSYLSGTLHYRDVSALMMQRPSQTLAPELGERLGQTITDARPRAYAGLLNSVGGGYGLVGSGYDLTEDATERNTEVSVLRAQGRLNQGADLQAYNPRAEFDPINVGNVHEKYAKAKNQNVRILSTYTEGLEVMLGGYNPVDIMDTVAAKINYVTSRTQVDDFLSNPYVVVGKASVIKSSLYAEKLELVRNNINAP
jgi:hypothetical protein